MQDPMFPVQKAAFLFIYFRYVLASTEVK